MVEAQINVVTFGLEDQIDERGSLTQKFPNLNGTSTALSINNIQFKDNLIPQNTSRPLNMGVNTHQGLALDL